LDVCEKRKVGEYATFCAVLTAYAESDFKWDARSRNPTSSGCYSEGVFQQTLPWWKNDHFDVAASCNAFLDNFHDRYHNITLDCWNVQRWNATLLDMNKFWAAPETVNYVRRISDVSTIIRERRVV
jgi:hypothetical protein